jgi:hypothetical protein
MIKIDPIFGAVAKNRGFSTRTVDAGISTDSNSRAFPMVFRTGGSATTTPYHSESQTAK